MSSPKREPSAKAGRIVDLRDAQLVVAQRFGCEPHYVGGGDILGASASFFESVWPIKGIRHLPVRGTTGWYIWAGEDSDAPDFYKPQHVRHLLDARAEVAGYLGLPPGWGFIIAPGYEDVWFDENLLVE